MPLYNYRYTAVRFDDGGGAGGKSITLITGKLRPMDLCFYLKSRILFFPFPASGLSLSPPLSSSVNFEPRAKRHVPRGDLIKPRQEFDIISLVTIANESYRRKNKQSSNFSVYLSREGFKTLIERAPRLIRNHRAPRL